MKQKENVKVIYRGLQFQLILSNETDCHNINEILLKVALSTIKGE
jgi:hypothetical protein